MKRRLGRICMILGAALVLVALSLFLWNQWEDKEAGDAAARVLDELIEQVNKAEPGQNLSSMTEAEVDGRAYIGYLSIPVLELELPVMSRWDYDRLKTAPCRYSGSTKTDDLVIAAHNYTRHFGPIKNLSAGDAVYFYDMDGGVLTYEVVEIDVLSPASVEEMTDSGYDLTLFTCTYGGKSRVTARCSRVKGAEHSE